MEKSEREPLAERIRDAIPLQNQWENFVDWLLEKNELFAKKYRYTLTARVIDQALDIQEKIIQARFAREKSERLERLHVDMEVMNALFRRCYHKKLFSASAYEFACKQMEEATKMIAAWKKYQKKEKEADETP